MSHKVELRHRDTRGGKLCEIEVEWRKVSIEPVLEVHTPLACDIVCDKEATDPGVEVVDNRRREGIVRIHVSMETGY